MYTYTIVQWYHKLGIVIIYAYNFVPEQVIHGRRDMQGVQLCAHISNKCLLAIAHFGIYNLPPPPSPEHLTEFPIMCQVELDGQFCAEYPCMSKSIMFEGPVTGILVRRGFWSGRTKIPRKRPDKTVRPRDFGPGTEVLV